MTGKQKNNEHGSNVTMIASFIMLVLSLLVMAGAFVLNLQQARLSFSYARSAGELQVLSQQIAGHAAEAVSGEAGAFSLLQDTVSSFDQFINSLSDTSLSPLTDTDVLAGQIAGVAATWSEMQTEAQDILAAEEAVLSLHTLAATLNETLPQLQIEYDEVVAILLDSNAPASQIALAQRQPWLAERIMGNAGKILEGGEDAIMAADSFGRDTKLFGRWLSGMLQGNPAMDIDQITNEQATGRLIEIAELFVFVDRTVDEILAASPELFQARQGADVIFADAQQLLQQTSILADTLSDTNQTVLNLAIITAGSLSLLFLLLCAVTVNRRLQQARQQPSQQGDQEQETGIESSEEESTPDPQAINQLFADMVNGRSEQETQEEETQNTRSPANKELGNGKRTVKTLRNDDFIDTSAGQLQELAEIVDQSATRVDSAVQETQATARLLAEASDHQAREINATAKSVNKMAQAINQMSSQASECARAAQHSGQVAANSSCAVRNSLDGIGSMHTQMQEATAWLKRLAESSREIVELVALVNDIADQTKILSLNATIQASLAGDAGRGFASAADEVQQLTERVVMATRQVGTLVANIESDASAAVNSMEQNTTELAQGSRLTSDAGTALKEIEQACNHLTSLIGEIAEAAGEQAESASTVARRMESIGNIATQTSSGTKSAAQSIGELTGITTDLRRSVMSLRLPATGVCHE